MTWLIAILLAVVSFAAAILLFRLDRSLWTMFAAVLVFGLAGYAVQASPDLPSAPKAAGEGRSTDRIDVVEARKEFIGSDERSFANFLVTSDAMARRGRFADAAEWVSGATRENPEDFEAWLALGIALIEHADGQLTAPALYALNQARALQPDHPAPGYFLGVSLLRQGQIPEARQAWADALANAPEDAAGREGLELRLARLDQMLSAAQAGPVPPDARR